MPTLSGDALPERTGGGLDSGRPAVLRVARTLTVELTEVFDVVERHRRHAEHLVLRVDGLDAGQVQQAVEQHRGVAVRQHEAVAVRPDRIGRIEAQVALPQQICHRRQRHRRARMARIGRLHRVHRQGANRVDAELIELRVLSHGCRPRVGFPLRQARARGQWAM
jgi:hypothetical protein